MKSASRKCFLLAASLCLLSLAQAHNTNPWVVLNQSSNYQSHYGIGFGKFFYSVYYRLVLNPMPEIDIQNLGTETIMLGYHQDLTELEFIIERDLYYIDVDKALFEFKDSLVKTFFDMIQNPFTDCRFHAFQNVSDFSLCTFLAAGQTFVSEIDDVLFALLPIYPQETQCLGRFKLSQFSNDLEVEDAVLGHAFTLKLDLEIKKILSSEYLTIGFTVTEQKRTPPQA